QEDGHAGHQRRQAVPAPADLAPLGLRRGDQYVGCAGHQSNLTRGSSSAYETSVSRLTVMTIRANTSVTPCTTGKSRLKIAVSIRFPMPGNANTFSTTSVPPTRNPMLMPRTVTVGITAFRS